ncbi:uncharacterized protein DFL_005273 [Arthrobotrys flagrans]|uniref:Uncharacterized protein n=1 Tax=Arthrobotrys flagrans TaxID=97331 RepID=A0A437A759_ARTFL|nr:hypothetical protein DFL_005273 [Arthrobotrys flagrans]
MEKEKYIKGLFWPSLLRLPFLSPVYTATIQYTIHSYRTKALSIDLTPRLSFIYNYFQESHRFYPPKTYQEVCRKLDIEIRYHLWIIMSIITGNNNSGPVDAKGEPVKEPVSGRQTQKCTNCGGVMYKKTIDGISLWECSTCKKTCAIDD